MQEDALTRYLSSHPGKTRRDFMADRLKDVLIACAAAGLVVESANLRGKELFQGELLKIESSARDVLRALGES